MGNRRDDQSHYDDDSFDLSESLKQQVKNQMEEDRQNKTMRTNTRTTAPSGKKGTKRKKKKKHTGLKIFTFLLVFLTASMAFLVFTKPGKKLLVKVAALYISNGVNQDEPESEEAFAWNTGEIVGRKEDYVTNILLIGVEEFGGAKNTDSMMIASLNSQDGTLQLTSLMRDSYVNIPGYKKFKLNAAFSHGGIEKLKQTIEENYLIHLDGYASVNFESFEDLVDTLGGVNIQLGEKEAHYLNTTNYISKKKYRNVKEGMNTLNGNQTLGYCRVRKVPTYDGVNNDFGRTLRQRRVLNAIFDKYKSQNPIKLISTTNKCMSYVTTSLTNGQIEKMLNVMVDNNITSMNQVRIPMDGAYESPEKYEGVTWPIVLDWDVNIMEMYKTIYGDTEEEAASNLALMRSQVQ